MLFKTHPVSIGLLTLGLFCLFLLFITQGPARETQAVQAIATAVDLWLPTPKPSTVSILFVGDMMFDRYIRQTIRNKGDAYVFACVKPLFNEADLVVGNLEGPITENTSVSEGSVIGSPENFRFTFPTTTATMLSRHNIRVVHVGNNHANDFGAAGIVSTRKFLDAADVAYFGGFVGDSPVHRTRLHGVDISFVSYNQFGGETPETVAATIAAERAADRFVIVYTHWGEEYIEVTERVRQIAKLFVEQGAHLIIGSHPHVVQTHEVIGTAPVYYSLGNFIFDQYWNEDVSHGLTLLVTISSSGEVHIQEKAITLLIRGQTCPQ